MDAYTALLKATDDGHFTSIRNAVEILSGYMEAEQIADLLADMGIRVSTVKTKDEGLWTTISGHY